MCNALAFAGVQMGVQSVQGFFASQREAAALETEANNLERQSFYKDEEGRTYGELAEIQKRRISEEASKIVGEGRVTFAAGNVSLNSSNVRSWELGVQEQASAQRADVDYETRLKQWRVGLEADELRSSAEYRREQAGQVSFAGRLNLGIGLGLGTAAASGIFGD